ncbi:MAG: superoxide dismutase [Rikenellaceae bacterium]|nr:superoxide dismutase [Rikenellaceae bacterium]
MKKTVLLWAALVLGVAYGQYTLPPLPYPPDALEPVLSAETVETHHGKHVQAYVDNLNRLVLGTLFAAQSVEYISRFADGAIYNNGAQIYNHTLYFDVLASENEAKHTPTGALAAAIDRDFGSWSDFKKEFVRSANSLFGSGWTWLSVDPGGKLVIGSYRNAGNPLKKGHFPLLGVDVWEHAYYIDYRNRKADYLDALWRIVDWKVIESRYENR